MTKKIVSVTCVYFFLAETKYGNKNLNFKISCKEVWKSDVSFLYNTRIGWLNSVANIAILSSSFMPFRNIMIQIDMWPKQEKLKTCQNLWMKMTNKQGLQFWRNYMGNFVLKFIDAFGIEFFKDFIQDRWECTRKITIVTTTKV